MTDGNIKSFEHTARKYYVFAFYFVDKLAAVFRLAPGSAFVEKSSQAALPIFGTAFANPLPSFHPMDLLVGVAAGLLLKLAVYIKGKNRKKFRQGEEYGWSAGWGRPDGDKSGEDFWVKAEKLYYTALIGYIWYEAPEHEKNFTTLLEMINASEAREDDETFKIPLT